MSFNNTFDNQVTLLRMGEEIFWILLPVLKECLHGHLFSWADELIRGMPRDYNLTLQRFLMSSDASNFTDLSILLTQLNYNRDMDKELYP